MAQSKFTDLAILSLPLRNKFRQIQTREIAIFKGERWSEFSPFIEYGDQESAQWLKAALSWANEPLPALKRTSIPVNATLPAVSPELVQKALSSFGKFSTVKVKVAESGTTVADDIQRLRKVRDLYPEAKIRLDANGAFDVETALGLIRNLADFNLDYFEQPVATIPELAQLRQKLAAEGISLKIAADESIRKETDPLLVAREGAADIAVIKVQPLGGIQNALHIAKESGLEVVVSSALESSIGLSHGLHLAGALDELKFDCGLATAALLEADVTDQPLLPVDGRIEIRNVEPSQELIEKYLAAPDRRDWWLARIDRCWSLLES
jgi:o-succinylbenzoate synthase